MRLPPVEGVEHADVTAAGVRFHVAFAGSGEPIVLLHGWPQHWWAWRKVIPRLAGGHRVVCPDLRGFGWSEAPPGAYEKEALAGEVIALLDVLGLERVSLVGHDWGGFVGFLACLRAPERFERLVALNIVHPWFRRPRLTPAALARTSYQYVLATPRVGEWTLRARPELVAAVLRRGSHPATRWTDFEIAAYTHAFHRPAYARASSALYRTFLTKELPEIARGRYGDARLTVPTVLLTGEADPVITRERLGGHEGHADDLRIEVVAGAGHFTPEEQPGTVAERVLDPSSR
jgi:pimeloyl-ACP methyl ester carboxylesterase